MQRHEQNQETEWVTYLSSGNTLGMSGAHVSLFGLAYGHTETLAAFIGTLQTSFTSRPDFTHVIQLPLTGKHTPVWPGGTVVVSVGLNMHLYPGTHWLKVP